MSGMAKCQTCGKTFVPCASCAKKNSPQLWRANCDTPECYQVFLAALEYRDGKMTNQQLRDGLSPLMLDKILVADNAVKKIILDALEEEPQNQARQDREKQLVEKSQFETRQFGNRNHQKHRKY